MLKFRQTQVKNKVVQLGSVTAILAVYWVLPTLFRIMADCAGAGSGSGCTG